MRYRLRDLLIVLAIGPPLLAGALKLGKSSWPLFLAMGYTAYIVLAIIISCVLAQAIDAFINRLTQK
jgi:hypothetical protein